MQASTEKFSPGKFLGEVRAELKKVHWPTKKELISYTSTVLLTVFILSVCIFAIDKAVFAALELIIGS